MRVMLRLYACLSVLSLAAPLAAQDEELVSEEEMTEEILVTGRGLDPALSTGIYATTTLERETIIAAPSGRIEDVLRGVAGFQQFRRSDSRSS
ncbi:MAG: TonB-dependent receptor, partial [Novosphingobium sp.]